MSATDINCCIIQLSVVMKPVEKNTITNLWRDPWWDQVTVHPFLLHIIKQLLLWRLFFYLPVLLLLTWSSFPLTASCDIRTDFPGSNNPLLSSQDQHHPNPTWQRRKLVLPWSGLNRRALLFCSASHLNEGRGLSVPSPGWSPCHCHCNHEC